MARSHREGIRDELPPAGRRDEAPGDAGAVDQRDAEPGRGVPDPIRAHPWRSAGVGLATLGLLALCAWLLFGSRVDGSCSAGGGQTTTAGAPHAGTTQVASRERSTSSATKVAARRAVPGATAGGPSTSTGSHVRTTRSGPSPTGSPKGPGTRSPSSGSGSPHGPGPGPGSGSGSGSPGVSVGASVAAPAGSVTSVIVTACSLHLTSLSAKATVRFSNGYTAHNATLIGLSLGTLTHPHGLSVAVDGRTFPVPAGASVSVGACAE